MPGRMLGVHLRCEVYEGRVDLVWIGGIIVWVRCGWMLVLRLGGVGLATADIWKGGIRELAKGIEGNFRVFEVKGEEVDDVNTGTVGLSGPR